MENFVPESTTAGAWHIVWQTVPGRDLLANPALAERIRLRLLDAHRHSGHALLHYLITPSEIHLLSRLPAGRSPGNLARSIGNIVARWVRQTQGVQGLVFAGRYRAYAISSDDGVRNEVRMLAWRPVAVGLCRAPTHHATSSLRTVLGLRRSQGLDTLTPLRLFGASVPDARSALRDWIANRPGAMDLRRWALTRGLAPAPGDVGALASVARPLAGPAAALVAAGRPPTTQGALALLERWVVLKLGLRSGRDLAALSSAAGARGRALVACLAVRLDLCSAATVARHFDRAKATLSERMAACRREPGNRAILGVPPERLVAEAIELARQSEAPSDLA